MAWPLQVDMQVSVFIPFLAIIMWKSHMLGCAICTAMIAASVVINMNLVSKFGITIGLIDTNNYFLLQAIISKPWTKLGNVGLGGLLACFYYRLLKYREAPKEAQS